MNTLFQIKLWSFSPVTKLGCLVSIGLEDSYLSCTSLLHTTRKSSVAISFHKQLTSYFWSCFPSPVIIHPLRTTLALIILMSFLINPHLLFTEGLSFSLDPKTLLYLENKIWYPQLKISKLSEPHIKRWELQNSPDLCSTSFIFIPICLILLPGLLGLKPPEQATFAISSF